MLGLTRISFSRWIHAVDEQGVDSLVPQPKPGPPAALTGKVRRELPAHLERSPQEFGLNRVQWDGPTLMVHLQRHFGIALKVRQAQSWLHQLGYRMKRASHAYLRARSQDTHRFQRALKKLRPLEADRTVVFQDETGLTLHFDTEELGTLP